MTVPGTYLYHSAYIHVQIMVSPMIEHRNGRVCVWVVHEFDLCPYRQLSYLSDL
jgi:hypothetical protein